MEAGSFPFQSQQQQVLSHGIPLTTCLSFLVVDRQGYIELTWVIQANLPVLEPAYYQPSLYLQPQFPLATQCNMFLVLRFRM